MPEDDEFTKLVNIVGRILDQEQVLNSTMGELAGNVRVISEAAYIALQLSNALFKISNAQWVLVKSSIREERKDEDSMEMIRRIEEEFQAVTAILEDFHRKHSRES